MLFFSTSYSSKSLANKYILIYSMTIFKAEVKKNTKQKSKYHAFCFLLRQRFFTHNFRFARTKPDLLPFS